jgi:hypothetical protein
MSPLKKCYEGLTLALLKNVFCVGWKVPVPENDTISGIQKSAISGVGSKKRTDTKNGFSKKNNRARVEAHQA